MNEIEKENFIYEYKILKAKSRLDILTSNLMYTPQLVQQYTEKSIKNGFKQLGFEAKIQCIMWDEYCSFLADTKLKPKEDGK